MPYRRMAEMPEEEEEVKELTDKEVTVKVWRMALTSMVAALTLILGYSVFSTLQNNQAALLKAQMEATPGAREATQARYLEAKALSDRAMFEQMSKAQEKSK